MVTRGPTRIIRFPVQLGVVPWSNLQPLRRSSAVIVHHLHGSHGPPGLRCQLRLLRLGQPDLGLQIETGLSSF